MDPEGGGGGIVLSLPLTTPHMRHNSPYNSSTINCGPCKVEVDITVCVEILLFIASLDLAALLARLRSKQCVERQF